jgi:hypothetical protein
MVVKMVSSWRLAVVALGLVKEKYFGVTSDVSWNVERVFRY